MILLLCDYYKLILLFFISGGQRCWVACVVIWPSFSIWPSEVVTTGIAFLFGVHVCFVYRNMEYRLLTKFNLLAF